MNLLSLRYENLEINSSSKKFYFALFIYKISLSLRLCRAIYNRSNYINNNILSVDEDFIEIDIYIASTDSKF